MFKITITTLGFLLFSLSVFGAGLTEKQQKQIIDTLKNYKPFKDLENQNVNKSLVLEDCGNTEYPRTNTCLEKKYIKNDNYIIELMFDNHGLVPIMPLEEFISTSDETGYWDNSKKTEFIEKWEKLVIEKLIGNDFKKSELIQTNKRIILIKIYINKSSLGLLKPILKNSRLKNVEYIGNPPAELEEILN